MSKLYVQHDYAIKGKDYVETDGGDTPAGNISYSATEHLIGDYDGTPVYAKTLFIETLTGNYDTVAHGISDLGLVLAIFGATEYTQGGATYHGMVSSYMSSVSGEYTGVAIDNTNLGAKCGSDIVGGSLTVTIHYTKRS